MTKKIITLVIVLLVIGGLTYLLWPHYINIYKEYEKNTTEQIDSKQYNPLTDKKSVNVWWRPISILTKEKEEEDWNIKFPEIDTTDFSYFLSGGRKILNIKYTIFDRISHDYSWDKNIYRLTVTLSKEWFPNTLFIYKTDKIYSHPLEGNTKLK